MSKSFVKRFIGLMDILNIENNNKYQILLKGSLIAGLAMIHGGYVYSTDKREIIMVTKKYKMTRQGFTEFMVIDDKGRHFNVNNSFWFNKWNSIEDWHNIEDNTSDPLSVRYYGWRIPLLGMFPNIVETNKKIN